MDRYESRQRLNDTLFALVLAVALAAAGWVAWATRDVAPATLVAGPLQVQLERVEVRAQRLPITADAAKPGAQAS
ncbi:MAG TPA: hypothetical protein VLU41_04830 [Ideonella sp.]|nr:hypothetical protein [Ideonella sp.]